MIIRRITRLGFHAMKLCISAVMLFMILVCFCAVGNALASGNEAEVSAAAMKMVDFASNKAGVPDYQAATTLVDYVLAKKGFSQTALPQNRDAHGGYYEFDTRIDFAGFMQYAYNGQIPAVLTSPSSLRYSR